MTRGRVEQPGAGAHRRLIDRLLLAAVPSAASFGALMPAMAGAGPADVMAGLDRLARSGKMTALASGLLIDARCTGATPLAEAQPTALPLPHPLDFEWRFSSATIDQLAARLIEATSAGDELLLVGTPSLAAAFSRTTVDRLIRFVGPDNIITAAVHDLFAGDPRFATTGGGSAAAAVVDPPWYADHFEQMLTTCARGCRAGAPVFTVVPRVGTRPGIPTDLDAMLARAAHLGLLPCDAAALEVRYRTPLFEARSLESAGIRADLGDWRRGDCLTLKRVDTSPPAGSVQMVDAHVELTLEGCRIRLLTGLAPDATGMRAVESNEVSTSVSARSSTRRTANLWTSTNRAFIVDERACLGAMIAIAEEEGIVLPARLTQWQIERQPWKANLVRSIRELSERERSDAARLAGEGSWLNTARDLRCSGAWPGTSLPIPFGKTAFAISSSRALVG